MRKGGGGKKSSLTETMLVFGLGLALVYWFLDSALQFLLTSDGNFYGNLIGFNISDIATRTLALCFFMIFGSHAQYTINRRREAESALQASEARYRTIIENIEDGYYETDLGGRLTFFNEAAPAIFQIDPKKLAGMNIRKCLRREKDVDLLEAMDKVLETGTSAEISDSEFTTREGEQRTLETSIALIQDPNGNPTGFRGIVRDITRRKRAEALLREKAAAEAANRSKSEFLANMSHEIRTPLSAIIGMVELLRDTDLVSEQREDLGVVEASAYSLLAVINDILDFSKIEAGKLELEEIPFSLRDFLAETLKILARTAQEKGLELACRVHAKTPELLLGDPNRLRQVVLNLVSNAIKFTESGEIVISIEEIDGADGITTLKFSARDTGIGVPEEKLEAIFSPFQQADGSTSRRFGGTGLGLAVSRQLVDLMGGRIWVESRVGQGSDFYFTARFRVQTDARSRPDSDPPVENPEDLRVLIVDDNAAIRSILKEMLADWNIASESATGAREAGSRLARNGKFDLLLVDSDMPETSGDAFLAALPPGPDGPVPSILMMGVKRRRGMPPLDALGVRATVTKPIRSLDLFNALRVALGQAPAVLEKEAGAGPGEQIYNGPPLNVLVAEDTPFNQKFISRLLERWGHRSVIVGNGIQALEVLSRKKFDIVLMDVQMPEMDGFAATQAIREKEGRTEERIPIIAMTAHAMKGDRERCIEAGMDDYVSKPISAEKLLLAISALVDHAPSLPAPAGGGPAPVTAPAPVPFDSEAVLQSFDGDLDFLQEAVHLFHEECPAMLAEIRSVLQSGDAKALERAAHSLKGMVGNFHYDPAFQAAYTLEMMGRNEDLDNEAEDIFKTLAAEIEQLEKHLRKLVEEKSP